MVLQIRQHSMFLFELLIALVITLILASLLFGVG